MKLGPYLEALGESESHFAKRAGLPQSLVHRAVNDGRVRIDSAAKIVEASKNRPASGGSVTFEDLVPEEGAA